MSKLTTYKNPSIETQLAKAPTIEELDYFRRVLIYRIQTKNLVASDKTVDAWNAALWNRVRSLMREQPENAPFIYNVVLRWPQDPSLRPELWALMIEVTKPLPNPCDR